MTKHSHNPRPLFRKKFKERESIFSQLINHSHHIRILYNIILLLVLVFFVTVATEYVINPEIAHNEIELIKWNVRQFFPYFTNAWLIIQLNIIVVYYGMIRLRWSLQRNELKKIIQNKGKQYSSAIKSCSLSNCFEFSFWMVHATNVSALVAFVTKYILQHEFSITMSFALTTELTRFVMKAHSYFIEKRIDNLSEDEFEDFVKQIQNNRSSSPSLSSLIYFLFAPTIIYRDSYPRSKFIHWRLAFSNMLQFGCGMLIMFYLTSRFLTDNFSRIGLEPLFIKDMARLMRNLFFYGVVLKFVLFFAFLHAYCNATAELLRFADRLFYKEFWQSMNMSDYYRKGTVIVQDWLFTYIYQPIRSWSGSNTFSSFAVIIISGIVHEYIIGMTLGFFFPALFFFFAIFGQFYYLLSKNVTPNNANHILSIFSILFGWGFISALYSMEYYSRLNCPIKNATIIDHIVPRIITCVKIK